MAQENNSALYTRNKVELVNNGTISLLGNSSTGMYAKFGVINNAGIITISDNSTGVYGTEDSILSNTGKITIGSNSTGMYSEGSTTTNLVNAGTIETSGNGSTGSSGGPFPGTALRRTKAARGIGACAGGGAADFIARRAVWRA